MVRRRSTVRFRKGAPSTRQYASAFDLAGPGSLTGSLMGKAHALLPAWHAGGLRRRRESRAGGHHANRGRGRPGGWPGPTLAAWPSFRVPDTRTFASP
jgi:hypothetical protein